MSAWICSKLYVVHTTASVGPITTAVITSVTAAGPSPDSDGYDSYERC